jgi:hypothetical protein
MVAHNLSLEHQQPYLDSPAYCLQGMPLCGLGNLVPPYYNLIYQDEHQKIKDKHIGMSRYGPDLI